MTSKNPPHASPPQVRSERTELAGDRTMLANERTLAAWWRTAMAAAAAAVAFARLFGDVQPTWLIRGGSSVLVGLAFLVLWVAFRRYRQTSAAIDAPNVDRVSALALRTGTLLLAIAAGAAGAAVWLY
jgi:putative membrane protein